MQLIFIFNRNFYVKSFHEFVKIINTSFDCILKMMKLLYEIFKINNYWFFIYYKHYIKRFVMIKSIYNSCLFHCIKLFVAINFQIDDILIFVNDDFAIKKKNEIIKTVNIMFKQCECFIIINSIKFNDMKIKLSENKTISIKYASNVKNISLTKNYKSSIISFKNVIKKINIKRSIHNASKTKCIRNFNLLIWNIIWILIIIISNDIILLNK